MVYMFQKPGTSPEGGSEGGSDDLTEGAKRIRQLQMQADKFHRLQHILMLSIMTATNIHAFVTNLTDDTSNQGDVSETMADLNMYMIQLRISKSRLDLLITRCAGISVLVSVAIDSGLIFDPQT